MIIIRPPFIFNAVWSICKYAFPKGAVKKMVFSGPNNHVEVLAKYVPLEILPPCIMPGGNGKVAIEMPSRLEGGLIPKDDDVSIETSSESSTCVETYSDAQGESLVSGVQSNPLKVRCTRIAAGSWASTSKGVQLIPCR